MMPEQTLNTLMMKRALYRSIIILPVMLLGAAIVSSCKPSQPAADTKDLSYLYNPSKNPFNARYIVTNQSENTSVLSVKLFASDLFFSEANPEGVPKANLLITVRLYNITEGRVLTDTAYYNLSVIREQGRMEYIYNVPLKVLSANEYMAEVRILDRLRLMAAQAFVPFNTMSAFNRYNYLLRGHFENNELFDPVLRINEYVNLLYLRGRPDSIYVSYFDPVLDVPDPPSMMLPEDVPSARPSQVVAIAYSDTLPMMLPREGIYLCSADRKSREGFALFNFGSDFPSMRRPETMIEPLAYLANSDELSELRSSDKPKLALDNFWISRAGNVEKARELIRIYYSRVLYSNYYFTSFKEGWRTERGMIYIIYGPPDKVYKTNEGETWGYRKPVISSSWGGRYTVKEEYLFFSFKARPNRFSDNDFYLSRSEALITFWDQAIASWRKGIVFRLDNPEDI